MSEKQFTKKCNHCNQEKPYSEFNRHKGKRFGQNYYLYPWCKACNTLKVRKKKGLSLDPAVVDKYSKTTPWLIPGHRRCSGCRITKPFSEYHKNKAYKNGIMPHCKECRSKQQKERIRVNQKAYTTKQRYYHERARWKAIFAQFGVTKEQYEQMHAKQDGKCAICKRPETFSIKGPIQLKGTVRRLAVDHSHSHGGRVRGLLCTRCNQGLGCFEDNVEWLQTAIDYLNRR